MSSNLTWGMLRKPHRCRSDISWELYHLDCLQAGQVLRNHDLVPRVSGTTIVVELDIPWDDSAVAKFGAAFKSWEEVEFASTVKTVLDSCFYNQMALVVPTLFTTHCV